MSSLLQQLKNTNIITESGQINKQAKRMLTTKYTDLCKSLNEQTSFLQYEADIRDRIFCVVNDITEQPLCPGCGNVMKFNHQKNRFNQFCPNTPQTSCSMSTSEHREQIANTLMERYGVDSPFKTEYAKNRRKEVMIERYGVDHYMKVDDHVDNFRNHMIAQADSNTAKRKRTMVERYGRETFAQTQLSDEAYTLISDKDVLEDKLKDFSKTEIAAHYGVPFSLIHRATKRHQIDYTFHRKPGSIDQQLIHKFVLQHYVGEIIPNDTSVIGPLELDLYLPEIQLAIEFNGVYFHGESKNRDRKYHANKTKACAEKGVRLLQIWSSEWNTKREIVLSRILSALGKSTSVYARKCEIVQLTDTTTERHFFDSTHIQGFIGSSVAYGLTYDGELCAVMSFAKSRFTNKYDWELLRYSSKTGITVVGGASRLFKHFIKEQNAQSIVSYCDLRWGTGKVYERLGFTYSHTSTPNYFYFKVNGDTNNLLSRQNFQKHKLANVLDYFDPNMTEWENMQENGYDRIWDCGNKVFVWRR